MILLNSAIVLVVFLVDSLGFLHRRSCCLQIKSFISSFPICKLFISFSSLLRWQGTLVQTWMSVFETEHPGLGSWWGKGAFSFPPLIIMFRYLLTFYQVNEVSFLTCWEVLSWMNVGILSGAFSEPIMFFSVNRVYHTDWWISMWNQSCTLG